jgi:MoaA/NifB/PqqE/SkfB family radical SAM enzyme
VLNINTNGMPLTAELAELLLESGVDLIVIGIDGFSKEIFEKIRVNADRDVVYANIEHLLALRNSNGAGPEIQVQFIGMDENEHELVAFTAYWLAGGVTLKVRKKLKRSGV